MPWPELIKARGPPPPPAEVVYDHRVADEGWIPRPLPEDLPAGDPIGRLLITLIGNVSLPPPFSFRNVIADPPSAGAGGDLRL